MDQVLHLSSSYSFHAQSDSVICPLEVMKIFIRCNDLSNDVLLK